MSLRGIYDGGGVRKQNGHYQSSIRRGGGEDPQLGGPGWHLIYEFDQGDDMWYEPMIFCDDNGNNIQVPFTGGEAKKYIVKCKSEGTYEYSYNIDVLAGRQWGAYLYQLAVGRANQRDYWHDEIEDEDYSRLCWSYSPEDFWPVGPVNVGGTPHSAYQNKIGESAYFLKFWGMTMNYGEQTAAWATEPMTMFLWETTPHIFGTIREDMRPVRYTGISCKVTSDAIHDEIVGDIFGGATMNAGLPVPDTSDIKCLNGNFTLEITSNTTQTLEFWGTHIKQEILAAPISGSVFSTTTRNYKAYVRVSGPGMPK